MLGRVYAPPLLTAALLCLGTFIALASIFPANEFSEILKVLQIPVVCAVCVSYSPDAWKGIWARRPTGLQQLTLGIVCAWIGVIGTATWSLLFRLAGQPAWMLNSEVVNAFSTLSLFGATLHITAPGALDGIPKKSMVALGLGLGTMAGFLALYLFLHPDVRGFTDTLRPWLEDRQRFRTDAFPAPPFILAWG